MRIDPDKNEMMILADDYAHKFASVGDDEMPKSRNALAQAILNQFDKIARLEAECAALKVEETRLGKVIFNMQNTMHQKSIKLDVMHWVWCSGGLCGDVCERDEAVLSALQHAQRRANEYSEPMALVGYENGVVSVVRASQLAGREPLEIVKPCLCEGCL